MSRRKRKHILEEPTEGVATQPSDTPVTDSSEPTTFEVPPPADDDPLTAPGEDAEVVGEAEATAVADEAETIGEGDDAEAIAQAGDADSITEHPAAGDTQAEGEPSGETEPAGAAEISTERVVEAILFASDEPLTPAKIVTILGTGSAREVRKIIQTLNETYTKAGHAYRIEDIAGGYQMLTLPEYNTWLRRLRQSRQDSKLTPAAMETLAVVAYKQPVVRAEVEAVRGVSVGEVLNRLRELGLIKIVGRAEDVGRPMLYGTTKHFLELFGLGSLEDLPAIEELQMPK